MQEQYDFIIIGAGIVGSMVARWLSRYEGRILWIEKEADICMGATAANTAIVHAGYDTLPGTVKAEMNVRGNAMWDQLSEELDIPFERRGDYVVAVGEEELPALDELMRRGEANGVPGMKILEGEEVLRRDPNLNPKVSGALWATTGGICDPWQATLAAAENAVVNGVELRLNTEFEDFIMDGDRIVGIQTNQGEFYSRWVINSAGMYSDVVMHKAGIRPEFFITPRRGEYYVLDRADFTLNNVHFPVPSRISKGILVTTTLHGNTILGPNAEEIEDRTNAANTVTGLEEVWEGAKKLVPGLNPKHVIAIFAGLRPGGNAPTPDPEIDYSKDFIIEIPDAVQGFVNLGGIESPGLTSAPAIAERVVTLLQGAGEPLKEKTDWNPIRKARPVFRHLSKDEQAALIEEDPSYGRIICRCEYVTEGEILAEIHAPIPATTYDALKRRTWLGTGRCQGGFDMPRVTEILSEELGIDLLEVTKKGAGSEFLARPTKLVGVKGPLLSEKEV